MHLIDVNIDDLWPKIAFKIDSDNKNTKQDAIIEMLMRYHPITEFIDKLLTQCSPFDLNILRQDMQKFITAYNSYTKHTDKEFAIYRCSEFLKYNTSLDTIWKFDYYWNKKISINPIVEYVCIYLLFEFLSFVWHNYRAIQADLR